MEKREFTFQNSEGDLIKKLALLGVRKRKEAANRHQVETEIGKKCYYTDIKTNIVNVYITLFKIVTIALIKSSPKNCRLYYHPHLKRELKFKKFK